MGKLLYDEMFRHVNYHSTDVRKTIARERKRLADLKAAKEAEDAALQAERAEKVRKIGKGAK